MGNIPVNFKGEAAAAISYLADQTGWTASEVLQTLLNIGLDLNDQGVFADVNNQHHPMQGVAAIEGGMNRVGQRVTDPDGALVRIMSLGYTDGSVTAMVTTDLNSAVTDKVDANTFVHRLADLRSTLATPR